MSVGTKEHKALLELTQYFSDTWEIVDVGANKGTWSDILMDYRDGSVDAGRYNVLMIEPNKKLCDYLEVKYDYNSLVNVVNVAADQADGSTDFWYWENKHSGLSSLYRNAKWDGIPGRKLRHVNTVALGNVLGETDILKIDVEGAEFNVLRGCEKLLEQKKVKFIQVEYSEHYKCGAHSFKELIEYAAKFGYRTWWYDGEYFVEQSADTFVEDYRLENFILTYKEIGRYHYTQLWNNEFKKNTEFIRYGQDKINLALEIGCFEGLTSNYICDHLLAPGGRLICVDPLEDYYLTTADKETNDIFVGQYERFIKNTKGQPIELQRGTSQDAFKLFKYHGYRFNFAYIDGDHSEDAVYGDGKYAFHLLQRQGYILFDDYLWREETKRGIDKFLEEYMSRIKILIKGYQVLIQRIS